MAPMINNTSFSSAVLSEALQTGSAEKAYGQLGFFEKIVDYFRGGVKWAEIESLIAKISISPHGLESTGITHTTQLARFEQLRGLAHEEHQDKFSMQMTVNQNDSSWEYTFRIDDVVILAQKNLSAEDRSFTYFQDADMLNKVSEAATSLGKPVNLSDVTSLKQQLNDFSRTANTYTPATNIARKFEMLAAQLPDLFCSLDINNADKTYTLNVTDRDSYHSTSTPVFSGSFASVPVDQETAHTALWSSHIKLGVERLVHFFEDQFAVDKFVEANVQCMVDTVAEQSQLTALLHDPVYSKANFTGIKSHDDPAKMIAVFGDRELVFSNRASTNHELRGEILKDKLQNSSYNSLYDIVTSDHQTEGDAMLLYTLTPLKYDLLTVFKDDMPPEAFSKVEQQVASLEVGKTTLGKFWNIAPLTVPLTTE